MSRIHKILVPTITIVLTALLFLHLQATQEFSFYYREQQQIFPQDWSFVAVRMRAFGGLATVVSMFLTQFFAEPYMGALTTAVVGGLTAFFLWLFLSRISSVRYLLPLAFIPILIENVYLQRTDAHYGGLVAMLSAAVCLWLYSAAAKRHYVVRCVAGLAATAMLYPLFGSVALLFAVCALLFDVLTGRQRAYMGLLYVLVVLVAGFVGVSNGWITDYGSAFYTGLYNEYYIEPTLTLGLAWLSLPLVMLVFWGCGFVRYRSAVAGCVIFLVLAIGTAAVYAMKSEAEKNKDFYTLQELYHYVGTEQWDKITSCRDINPNVDLHMNCLNLALSHEDRLVDDLFKYPQRDVRSLITNLGAFTEENILFTQMYYRMGVVSQALKLGFGTEVGIKDGNPTVMKTLVKTRLIYGEYAVADKYLSLLEKTRTYRDWARQYRRFLYDDTAVEADAELGMMRRSLPHDGAEFVSMRGVLYDLLKVLEANPQNGNARDYAIAFMLLQKDFNQIRAFVDTYYGTPVLPELPVRLQEAVVSYAERDADYCLSHGVTQQTLDRFADFRQKTLGARRNGGNVKAALRGYSGTFWYDIVK